MAFQTWANVNVYDCSICSVLQTKQWVDNLKMNGSVDAVAFNADGSRMFTAGGTAHVLLSV